MIDLLESRDKIDKIDMEIVRLFEERMKICEDVAEYKIATGKKVLDAERERQKLKALRGRAHGEFNQLGTQELFEQIMAISRKRQYQDNICLQSATFSRNVRYQQLMALHREKQSCRYHQLCL